jgi:hypothetical protein
MMSIIICMWSATFWGRPSGGALHVRLFQRRPPALETVLGGGALNALFDFADRGEVFLELVLVAGVELALDAVGLVLDEFEDTLVASQAGGVEKAVKDLAGEDLGRDGRGFGTPGHGGGVNGGGAAGKAVAGGLGAEGEAGTGVSWPIMRPMN